MNSTQSADIEPFKGASALILEAWDRRHSILSFSERDRTFDLAASYRIAVEVPQLREARGEPVIGRKIGFTNTTI